MLTKLAGLAWIVTSSKLLVWAALHDQIQLAHGKLCEKLF